MSTESLSEDELDQVAKWDAAYGPGALGGEANLWGDPPVPYARIAAELFAAAGAAVVLDLPCGDGRNLPPLATGAPILLAGDTSATAMGIARAVTERAGVRDRVVFTETDAYRTGLLDASVDGIFCWDLLGHLTDPAAVLVEFDRILRPGGCLVANMWTMADCQIADDRARMTEIAPRTYLDHADFYCKFYDEADLTALLDSVGQRAESVRTESWWEPPHPGYRDYVHQHESLVFHVRKAG